MNTTRRRPINVSVNALALLTAGLLALAGCASSSGGSGSAAVGAGKDKGPAATLRLGYFANVTHATPVVGVAKGFYAKHLGATRLETQIFNAGPAAVEAIFAGSLDAAYLGPNPAINAYAKSHGSAIRIVAGATTGGAALVVRKGVTSADQLKGATLATPQLGGTQDVALRAWLADKGLKTSLSGKGDVTVAPSDNATTLQLFKDKKIDGAWVPEPWASRLVLEGGGTVLVDERSLWPGGRFVTTHLVVATRFLDAHPQTVKALLEGQVETNRWISANATAAQQTINAELLRLTGKKLKSGVIKAAFAHITVTNDPVASSLAVSAKRAEDAGLLKHVDLHGIYDLTLLNAVLRAGKDKPVDAAGLGKA